MLTRYWQWTSAPVQATSLPFGPLRYRGWTSAATPTTPATSGLPFGPLRFRAWTTGDAIVVPPVDGGGGSFRIPIDDRLRRFALQRDDELLLLVAAAFVTIQ
jgi:hypothetical protein